MKKIFYSIIAIGAMLLSSCSMDTAPKGVTTEETGVANFEDLQSFRNGLYSMMRSFGTGGYVYLTELQMDNFLGTQMNGNRNGMIAGGTIQASDGDITSIWAGCYSRIGQTNFFLAKAQELIDNGVLSDDEVAYTKGYMGEAHFLRAWMYIYLFDHFCQTYSADKANTPALGLPLVTVFAPTPNRDTYPGRSTMAQTFELIDADLQAAFDALCDFEMIDGSAVAQNSAYVSSYTVQALWARSYLLRGQDYYQKAIENADDVINAGVWRLTPYAQYANLWTNDQGTELIFRPYVASTGYTEAGGVASIGGAYNNSNFKEADYLPTYGIYSLYDPNDVINGKPNDVRASAFFSTWNLNYHGSRYNSVVFYKFPGNTSLNMGNNAQKNMPKPFRLSELYLIKAEAAAALGDEPTANQALAAIRTARMQQPPTETYSGDALRDEIRNERNRELVGEGFRMSDLRRWNLGFSRVSNFPGYNIAPLLRETDKNVVYSVGDHRYVWPIPQDEIETNPQIAGQQNPGY